MFSRGRAMSEIKRIFSKMRFPFLSFFSFFSSFSLFPSSITHLPPMYREKERGRDTDGTPYERNRRITFVVRIFISKNYGPFEGFSTIHFGVSGNPSLFEFACESTECRASFMPGRVHLRVTTDSVRPCAIPRKEVLPRFEEGKICRLTVVFVSSRKYAPPHHEFNGRTSPHFSFERNCSRVLYVNNQFESLKVPNETIQ